jgi:hypothetical protein
LLEWLPSRTQTTTNVGKAVGEKEHTYIPSYKKEFTFFHGNVN